MLQPGGNHTCFIVLACLLCLLCCAAKGLARGAPVVSGMIGLAELRLEAGDAAGALAAAKQGLKFVFDRSKVSGQPWLVPMAEEQNALR